MMRQRNRTIGLASDDRARIPFAVIAVLLLISSIAIVGGLEQRTPSQPDIDPSLAIDRTESATQTAIRDAIDRATGQAAERPLTSPNLSNEYGQVIAGTGSEGLSKQPPADGLFENYLRALIYLEVTDTLPSAGQEIRDIRTTVSVPPVESPDDLDAGIDRVEIVDAADGTLTVRIENVTTTVTRDGQDIASERENVTVTVATPVFQLHEKVSTYETKLNAGIHESGFGQQFNARIYAIGWARGWAQYGGMPVTEVLANRHIVPSANSANYATQMQVFGTKDPAASNAMTQGWLCMAIQDSEELYGGYQDATTDQLEGNVDGDDMCDSLSLVYGEQVGEENPDEPSVQTLLGNAPGMDEAETIGINQSAYLPLRYMISGDGIAISEGVVSDEIEHDHSFEDVLQRIYTVEAGSTNTVSVESGWKDRFNHTPANESYSIVEQEYAHQDSTVVSSSATELGGDGYYRFQATVVNTVSEVIQWEYETENTTLAEETSDTIDVELSFRTTISESDNSPEAIIDEKHPNADIDMKYEVGAGDTGVYSMNYYNAPDEVATEMVGGTSNNAYRSTVRSAASTDNPADVSDQFENRVPDQVTLSEELEYDVLSLQVALVDDLTTIQEDVSDISVTFERSALIHDGDEDGPFDALIEEIEHVESESVDAEGSYGTVGEKAIFEARAGYFALLKQDVELLAASHSNAMGSLDEELEEVNSGLGDAVGYLRRGTSIDDPGPGELHTPALVSDVEYEITGSPTYLVNGTVTQEDVPPVNQDVEFAPLATRNENFLSIPYDTIMTGILRKIPKLDFGSEDAAVSFRVAGEALHAVKLADELTDEPIEGVGTLDSEVTAAQYTLFLLIEAELLAALDLQANSLDLLPALQETIESEWDETDQQAIALGDGDAIEPITDTIVEKLDDDTYRPSEYDDSPEVWRSLVESTARPLVSEQIGERAVTLDDVDEIEDLDRRVREELESVSGALIEERLEDSTFEIGEKNYDEWVDGIDTPNRVPAGLPLLPVPGYWFATVNVWDVSVHGEYARFEATANMGTPTTTTGTTYVRENASVSMEINGEDTLVGTNDELSFDGSSVLVVVVPPGAPGVGDRTGDRTECSPTYPIAGPILESDAEDNDETVGLWDTESELVGPHDSDPSEIDECAETE